MSIPFIQRDNISIYVPYRGDEIYIDINKIYVLLECASKYEQLQKENTQLKEIISKAVDCIRNTSRLSEECIDDISLRLSKIGV